MNESELVEIFLKSKTFQTLRKYYAEHGREDSIITAWLKMDAAELAKLVINANGAKAH